MRTTDRNALRTLFAECSTETAPPDNTPEVESMGEPERGPRERMVISAAALIRRDGVGATGLRDVVAHAEAPRGSLQHYFPGGKQQLIAEAVDWAGRYASKRVDVVAARLSEPTPSALFRGMAQQWIDDLRRSDFGAGCPVVAATVDAGEAAGPSMAPAAAFASWRRSITSALGRMGVPSRRAGALATLMISALEGAILIARAERDVRALRTVARELGPALDASG